MSKRKNKLVNRKFQLKTAYSVMGVIFIAFLLILAMLGIEATTRNRDIVKTLTDLDNAIAVEDNIVNAFVEYARRGGAGNMRITVDRIVSDHDESIRVMKDLATLLRTYEERNFLTLSAIIGIIVLLAVFLYFYLINLTHRISGPLYVMKGYMDDIIEGRRPHFRKLREKDEFKEFYETFIAMTQELPLRGDDEEKDDR